MFGMEQQFNTLQIIAVWVLPVLFAITVHEVAHGWVASKLGDKTALMMGRLTLNPARHIDPIGTIIVPGLLLILGGFIFGWAKPVPIDWHKLKNPRRDIALVAIAGPLANICMAIMWAITVKLALFLLNHKFPGGEAIFYMGKAGITINLMLAVLNMLPIPPLDGSRIISSLLPPTLSQQFNRLEPFGFFVLLALLALGILPYLIAPPVQYLYYLLSIIF